MPLLLTPPAPLLTTASLPVASVYAIIDDVKYSRAGKTIAFEVGYYASEEASVNGSTRLQFADLNLPGRFFQPATPTEANGVPIFDFLEQVLTATLTPLLPAGTAIANVP